MAEAVAARLTRWAASRQMLILVSALAGALAGLGQAPYGLPLAMLAGFALAFALWRHTPTLALAAWAGWGLGLGYFGVTLSWIVHPFFVDAPRHGWMAPFALLFLAGGLALFWSAAAMLSRLLVPARLGWLGWAGALAAAELMRGVIFTGFPWAGPGQALIDTPFAQLASLVGAEGLGFLVLLTSSGLVRLIEGPTRRAGGLVLLAAFAGALGFGLWREGLEVSQHAAQARPILRLVQPNAPQAQKWDPEYAWSFVERQLAFTGERGEAGAPDLVIWPETAIPLLLDRAPALLTEIAASAAPAGVILGAQREEDGRYFNALVVLGPDGTPAQIYDKHHLVPFGEYMPLARQAERLGLAGLAQRMGTGYSKGPGARVLDLAGAGKVLPLICYEAIFARDLRAAPERADWILQITNDAWFGVRAGPYQHLAQARFRAVEFGLPLVRVANTGVSAVIGPLGDIRAALPLGQAGFLDAPLPGALPATFYASWGDAPLVLLLAAIFAGLWIRREKLLV